MSENKKRKKSWLKRILVSVLILSGVVLVLLGTLILLYSKTDLIEKAVVDYLNTRLKGQGRIDYATIRGSLLNNIEIENLEIVLDNKMRVRGNYIELNYELYQLLYDKVKISKIFIDRLEVEILPSPAKKEQAMKETKVVSVDSTLNTLQNFSIMDSLFENLPEFLVADVELFAGSVHFKEQPLTLTDLNIKIDHIALNKENFQFKLAKVNGKWLEKDLELQNLSFILSGDRKHLTLNQFDLRTKNSKLSGSAYYRYKEALDISLDVPELFIDLNEIYKISGIKDLERGFLEGNISVSGQPLHFASSIDLHGRWQDHNLDKISLRGEYNQGLIILSNLEIDSDAGQVKIEGEGRENQAAKGNIKFSAINLQRLSNDLLPTDLNGNFEAAFESLHFSRPTGRGSLTLSETRLDSILIDSMRFALQVESGNWMISKPSFLEFGKNSRFELEGTLNREQEIDLTISSFNNQMSDLARALRWGNVNGLFDLRVHTFGKIEDPSISGSLSFAYLKQDSIQIDSVKIQLYVQNILSERRGEIDFTIDSASIYSVPLNDVTIAAGSWRNELTFEEIRLQSNQNYLSARAQITYDSDSIKMVFPYFKVEYEKYWLQNEENIVLAYDSSGLWIENLKLQGPQSSRLHLTGKWDRQVEDLYATITVDRLEIEPFEQFWNREYKVQGTIAGGAEINRLLTNPNLDLDLSIKNLIFNGIEIGDLSSNYQFRDSSLYISELTLQKDDLKFEAGGNFGFGFGKKGLESFDFVEGTKADFKVNWANIDLSKFAPLFKTKQKVKGQVSGYMEVGGNISRPQLRQYLSLDDFEYGDLQIDSLRMFGQYNSGYLIVDSLSAIFNHTKFDLRGWQKYDLNLADIDTNMMNKPINLFLRSQDDKIDFLGLFNEQLESISGAYELELHVGGTPEKPAMTQGFIKMEEGSLLLARVMDPIEKLKIDIAIADSILHIKEFSGYSVEEKDFWEKGWRLLKALIPWSGRKVKEGFVEVEGDIVLKDVMRPRLDLTIKMDELYINYFIENTKLLLTTADMTVRGQDTILVEGGIYIPKAEYEVDLSKMEKNIYLYETTVQPLPPPYLAVNLNVQIPGGFTITSSPLDLTNNFRIGIQGDLQVILEPEIDLTQITGHLDVNSGKYASWNQNFEVKSGSIDFINPKILNPDINIVAAKKLGPRLFEIIISGNLEKLSQQIRVTENNRELDIPMMDKIAMLTLGTDVQQLTANADSTIRNVGSDIATTSLLTAVERGTEQLTGLDKVEISSSENILDLNKFKLNNGLKDASISFGKYLTTDLYIEYRTQFNEGVPAPRLSWDSGNRLSLQYRINRFWSFDSYYEKTLQGNNKIQLGLNWEYNF